MAQATLFPIRYGLQLPPPENKKAVEVFSEGGLDLTQSIIENRPGCASSLVNFEASLTGGYRRINGFAPYSSSIVPGQGPVLGVAVSYPSYIVAARQDASDTTVYNLYYSTGTTWTKINPSTTTKAGTTHGTTSLTNLSSTTGLIPGQPVSGSANDIPAGTFIVSITNSTSLVLSQAATGSNSGETITFSNPLSYSTGMTIRNTYYNWTGVIRVAFFDGVNYAYRWDHSEGLVILTGTAAAPAPANPQFGKEFYGYLWVGGFSSNYGAVAYCAPNADTDWATADGAATIVIGDTVTSLNVWRQQLIIFNTTSIYKAILNTLNTTGITPPPEFQVQQITDRIGCFDGKTVQEIGGDLVFLAPDGIRTISGTFNIGDTEIASISRPIQNVVSIINSASTPCYSLVVHRKTQYRLFYPPQNQVQIQTAPGIMGSIRRFRDGHEGWEWCQLSGVQPSCTDSNYLSDGNEYAIFGGVDGYIYRLEQGNTFTYANGMVYPIGEVYTTVPLELGDQGLKKSVQRITIYVISEVGELVNLVMNLTYDYNNPGIIQPSPYNINISGLPTTYDSGADYDAITSLYDAPVYTSYRQLVQGSGFNLQIQMLPGGIAISPYTIQGYYIEFFPGARR
jgi:hypothetical protein